MTTFREKLKDRGQAQISMWLPSAVVDHAKALAADRGLSLPKLFVAALEVYSGCPVDDSKDNSVDTGIVLTRVAALERALSGLADRLETQSNPLNLAERLDAIEASISSVVSSVSALSVRVEQVESVGYQGSELISDSDKELMALGNVKAAYFLDENGQRNRRILQMHRDGMNPNAIGSQLKKEGIENCLPESVKGFLRKCGIVPHMGNYRGRAKSEL